MKERPTSKGSGNGVRSWCLFRQDHVLREVVQVKSKDHNMAEICREVGLDYNNFRGWKSGRNPKAVTQYDLYRLLKRMGIKVGIKIEYV